MLYQELKNGLVMVSKISSLSVGSSGWWHIASHVLVRLYGEHHFPDGVCNDRGAVADSCAETDIYLLRYEQVVNVAGPIAKRIIRVGGRRDEFWKFTFEEWALAAFDTHVITADELLPGWLAKVTPASDDPSGVMLDDALDQLRRWNHEGSVDFRGNDSVC